MISLHGAPHRAAALGWSATSHLNRDLERHFGMRAARGAIHRALRVLARRGRIDLRVARDGSLWFRLRDERRRSGPQARATSEARYVESADNPQRRHGPPRSLVPASPDAVSGPAAIR